jgi:translation elongation factor EF-4
VQERFASEDIQVANAAGVQDIERAGELVSIEPAKASRLLFVYGEVAEIACGVAGIRNCNVADTRATVANQAQHIPGFCDRGAQFVFSPLKARSDVALANVLKPKVSPAPAVISGRRALRI